MKLGQAPDLFIHLTIERYFAPKDRVACQKLLRDEFRLFERSPGSSFNHQAWPGGYLDHVAAVLRIAIELWPTMLKLGPCPFELAEALLVLFLHDLEKPWRPAGGFVPPVRFDIPAERERLEKKERHVFRLRKIAEYGLTLTGPQENAIRYVEGEGDDYSGRARTMNELAAFCHMCDVASARIWHSVGYYAPPPKFAGEPGSFRRPTPPLPPLLPGHWKAITIDEEFSIPIKADRALGPNEFAIESGGKRTTFKLDADGKIVDESGTIGTDGKPEKAP
jgi:hypothetical protein